MWPFDIKKRRAKRELHERKLEYAILLKKLYDKHNFIAIYHGKKAKERGDSAYMARHEDTQKFRRRIKQFFDGEFGECPGSFSVWASVSYFNPNFDYYPVEKLQKIYDKIEDAFPEPFEEEEYEEKEYSKEDILTYEKYPIFAKKKKDG